MRSGENSRSYRVESVKGDIDRPMSTGQVITKAREYMTPVIGAEKSGQTIDTILNGSLNDAIRPL